MTQLPKAWFPLRYHYTQCALWRDQVRFKGVQAGRGSGKTELARRYITQALSWSVPGCDTPKYFYTLPTYNQAKRVAWEKLQALVPPQWLTRHRPISQVDLTIKTRFGSTLWLLGMDQPQRAEGVQWNGGVNDESSDTKPGVWTTSLLPAMSEFSAWCWRIGVTKRYGIGAQEFNDFCDVGASGEDSNYKFYHWPSADIILPAELEIARRALDERDFNEQYFASREQASGAIYHAFSDANVTPNIDFHWDKAVIVGSDFNVNPMCWVIGQEIGNELWIMDEIFKRHTNTEDTLTELASRYVEQGNEWEFFGDASGKARKTSATSTDYLIIRSDERFNPKRVLYPRSNPALKDRFATSNRLMCNAAGDRRLKIHPRCKRLINDLKKRQYAIDCAEPDDPPDIGHMSDALGYIIHPKYPIHVPKGVAKVSQTNA